MEKLQLDVKTLSKRGNKFDSEIKCFPSAGKKRAALGIFFFFFEFKKKKRTAGSEIILLFNLLNCTNVATDLR